MWTSGASEVGRGREGALAAGTRAVGPGGPGEGPGQPCAGRAAGSGRERRGSLPSRAAGRNVLDGEGPFWLRWRRAGPGAVPARTPGGGEREKRGPAAKGPPVGREGASPPGPARSLRGFPAGLNRPGEAERKATWLHRRPVASQLGGVCVGDAGEQVHTPHQGHRRHVPVRPHSTEQGGPAPHRSPGYRWRRPAPTHVLSVRPARPPWQQQAGRPAMSAVTPLTPSAMSQGRVVATPHRAAGVCGGTCSGKPAVPVLLSASPVLPEVMQKSGQTVKVEIRKQQHGSWGDIGIFRICMG